VKLYEPRRGLYWELGVTGDRVVYVEDGEIVTELPQDVPLASRDAVSFDVRGRDMKARSASAIYREAAEHLATKARWPEMCWSIVEVIEEPVAPIKCDFCRRLADWFSPNGGVMGFTRFIENSASSDKISRKNWRILMLLLMSEIAKDEQ
jgi:hypothetical protein